MVGGVGAPVLETGRRRESDAAVLVHGNPGSSADWEDLMERIAPVARAVAPDLPGFGRADKPDGFDHTITGYARWLAGCLEQLRVRRAHLVLHDIGGPIGLMWAALNPAAFASVILFNTGVLPGYRGHPVAWLWQIPLVGEISQMLLTRPLWRFGMQRAGRPKGLPPAFVDRMYDDFDWGTRAAILRLYRSFSAEEMATAGRSVFRSLNRPALVLWGRHDPFVDVAFAERQREAFPDARVVVLDDCGHWPFVDAPERVGDEVARFLKSQVRAST